MRGIVLAVLLLLAGGAAAQELTIGLATEASTLDPHFRNTAPNFSLARHVFEPLVDQDAQQRPRPGLALSWEAVDATTWRIHLRPGVRFSDGSPFTAEDAAFSLRRSANITGSPGSYAFYTSGITAMETPDPLTLVVRTRMPDPLLPTEISVILMLSARAAAGAGTEAFDRGTAALGTGPYRIAGFSPGTPARLVANAGHHGGRPPWQGVTLRLIPEPGPRVAALLAGDVQAIDAVPPESADMLGARGDLRVVSAVSNRLIFLAVDTMRPQTPGVTDATGVPLAANPLRDPRVRRAISLAINRAQLAQRTMQGMAVPAGQLLPDGFYGVSASLLPDPFDPVASARLLAEAGLPDGFALTLVVPNNRYVNDRQTGEAIAGMLTRAGLRTTLAALPSAQVMTRLRAGEVSLMLWGWASETGEPSGPLRALLATPDPARGFGEANRLRYSNPALDALLERALVASDPEREALLQRTTEVAMADRGLIPLMFHRLAWAMKRPLTLTPNPIGTTYAWLFSQAP